MPRRRRRSSGSLLLLLLLLLIGLPVAIGAGVALFVDPNGFKPRIAESVRAATGRDIALDGPIHIGFSATPTLMAEKVRLSNPPGFSRPDMATLSKVEAELALWPLLRGRLEIVRLTLTEPDLLLETDAEGQSNWRFAPMAKAATPGAPSQSPAPAEAPHPSAPRFAVGDVRIVKGRLTWRDTRMGQSREADITRFDVTSAGKLAPVSASGDLVVEGHNVTVSAETGPMEQLLGGDAMSPGWPLQIVARVEGARLAASGSLERPLQGRGYQLTLDATAPDLTLLSKAIGQTLPPLRDLSVSAKLSDTTGAPLVSTMVLRAGASDLGAIWPSLALDRVELTAAALTQPVHAEFDATLAGKSVHGVATTTLPPGLAFASGTTLPVEASLQAEGAVLSTKGNVVLPRAAQLGVAARIPDLAALQPFTSKKLPSLHDLGLEAAISERDGDLANGVMLRNLKLTGPQGEINGELALALSPRVAVQGQLSAAQLDLDVILADLASPSAPQPAPATPPPAAPASSSAPPAAVPATPAPKRIFSDRPFSFAALAGFDADLRFTIAQLRAAGATTRDLAGRIELTQGRLALDPFSGTSPGGRVEARLAIDSKQPEPPISLAIAAPGLVLKPLLTAFGLPDDVNGSLDVQADLTATGSTPYAIAASLSGKLGLSTTDAEIDNRMLAQLVDMLRVAKVPAELFGATGSRTRLRCFATRLDAQRGVAGLSAFVLDTGRALVQAAGIVNLGDEIVGLRLRPLLRSGGGGVVLPVRVAGPMRQPNVALDSGGAIEGIAGNLAGNIAGLSRNPLAALGQALAGERGGDACGPAVAAARAARPSFK